MTEKQSTGPSDRPRDTTIAQTGPGMPDDTGDLLDITDDEVERVRQKLTGNAARDQLKEEVQEAIDLPQKGSA